MTIKRKRLSKPPKFNMRAFVYKSYIASPKWVEMKRKYKKPACELCGAQGRLELHHLTYDNLTKETAKDFATLCRFCHQACHIDIVSTRRLSGPSKSVAKLVRRIRNGNKLTQTNTLSFIRRRFIAEWSAKKLPSYDKFRLFYASYIRGTTAPFVEIQNIKSLMSPPSKPPKEEKPPKLDKRIFNTRIVVSSGLPETLHHSLQNYRNSGDVDRMMEVYELRKKNKDPRMYQLFVAYREKVYRYLSLN